MWSDGPNLTDFTSYVYAQGVSSTDLPTTSVWLQYAFNYGVNLALNVPQMDAEVYTGAVYNLGMHRLLRIAQDISPSTFFEGQRTQYGLLSLRAGIVMASGDGPDSQTTVVPEVYQNISLQSLELTKTPWGREYNEYAQMYGSYVVGVS